MKLQPRALAQALDTLAEPYLKGLMLSNQLHGFEHIRTYNNYERQTISMRRISCPASVEEKITPSEVVLQRSIGLIEMSRKLIKESKAAVKACNDSLTRRGKRLVNAHVRVRTELNNELIKFLKTDLKVAQTFITIATQARSGAKRQRNCKKARVAYDTVLRQSKQMQLCHTDRAEIDSNLLQLKAQLEGLGESF